MASLETAPFRYVQRRDAVKMILQAKGWSLDRAEKETGVDRSTIGHLRSGKRKTANPVTVGKLAKGFGMPEDAIFLPVVEHVTETANQAA